MWSGRGGNGALRKKEPHSTCCEHCCMHAHWSAVQFLMHAGNLCTLLHSPYRVSCCKGGQLQAPAKVGGCMQLDGTSLRGNQGPAVWCEQGLHTGVWAHRGAVKS